MAQAGSAEAVRQRAGALDFLARRRYFLDAIYGVLYRVFLLGFSRIVGFIDRYLVDGCLNVASAWTLRAGTASPHPVGQAQDYVYGVPSACSARGVGAVVAVAVTAHAH